MTRPDILRVVVGPYVQYCPCEASEQKLEQEPKYGLKVLSPFDLFSKKRAYLERMSKNDRVVPN